MKIDYLIKNGTIIDGSGDNRYEADILISDDQIVSILSKGQKTIKINDVLFKVEKNIPRCVAINLKPETDDNSFNLLKTLKQTYDHYDMGVYLTPEKDGEINIGEEIIV